MAARKSPRKAPHGTRQVLDAYRKVRKPMPPPERVIPDKRRKRAERVAEREQDQEETP